MVMVTLEGGGTQGAAAQGLALLGTLAWPLALVVLALVFRPQLVALFARLDELRWGDKAARFSRRLDRLERAAAPLLADQTLAASDEDAGTVLALSGDHVRFLRLLDLSPNAAVLDAWDRVEEGLAGLSRRHGTGAPALLRPQVPPMLSEMARLRAAAAHGEPITVADALRFRNLSKRVVNELNLL